MDVDGSRGSRNNKVLRNWGQDNATPSIGRYDIPIDPVWRVLAASGLSNKASGLYATALMVMLQRQRPLPADAAKASKILRVDPRSYRSCLDELLADGALVRLPSGEITSPVVASCKPSRAQYIDRGPRAAIPSAARDAVLAKTGGRCTYCAVALTGDSDSPTSFQPDHVLPVVLGGSDDIGNLVPSCRSCNAKKRAQTALRFLSGGNNP